MSAKVEVLMTAKDAEVVAAWQRARNNVGAFNDELNKVLGTNVRLEAAGKKVWDQTRTPLERYNAEVERLGGLLKDNAIDQETYNRAVQQQKTVLDSSDESLKKLTASNQELEAAGKRVWEQTRSPLERYNAEVKRLDELLKSGKIDQESYNRAIQQQNTILGQTDEELKRVHEENQKLEQSGKRVWEQNRTPLERYNQSIKETDQLLKAGKISQETHSREIQRQKDLYSQASNSSKSFLGGISSGTMQVVAGLTGVGTVIAGIMAVAAQLRAEYDNMVSRQKSAADRQTEVATAQAGAYANLGDEPGFTPAMLDQRAQDIATKRGVPLAAVYNALSSSLSARGNLPVENAIEAVDVSAILNPGDSEGMIPTSGSILDVQKKEGGTAKEIGGQLMIGKQMARVVRTGDYARNLATNIPQLQSFGNSRQESIALSSALTQLIGDPSGEMSATAGIGFAKQLEEKLGYKIKGTIAQVEYLRSEAGTKDRDKLLGKGKVKGTLTGEGKAIPAYRGILTPGSVEAKLFDDYLAKSPDLAAGGKAFEGFETSLQGSAVQQNALYRRKLQALETGVQVEDISGAQAGITREGLGNFLKANKAPDYIQKIVKAEFEARTQIGGADDIGFAKNLAEKEIARLKTDPQPSRTITMFGGIGGGSMPVRLPADSPKEVRDSQLEMWTRFLEITEKQLESQKKMVDMQAKQLQAQQEANKKAEKPIVVNVDGKAAAGRDNTPTKARPAEALNAPGGG